MQWVVTRRGFKRLILFKFGLGLVGFIIDRIFENTMVVTTSPIGGTVSEVAEFEGPILAAIAISYLVYFVALYLLYRLKRLGGLLLIGVSIFDSIWITWALSQTHRLEYSVYSFPLTIASGLLDGFILALVYFSPLKDEFK